MNIMRQLLARRLIHNFRRCCYQKSLSLVLAFGLSLLLGLIPLISSSQAVPISSVPDPRLNNSWVADTADLLSPSTEDQLNQIFSDLEAKNGTEIIVVTVLDTQTFILPQAFSSKLIRTWKLGKKDLYNGGIILISKNENQTVLDMGPDIPGKFSNDQYFEFKESLREPLEQENLETNLVAVSQAMFNTLENQTFIKKPEIPATRPPNSIEQTQATKTQKNTWGGVIFLLATVTISSIIMVRKTFRKGINPARVSPVGTTQTLEPEPIIRCFVDRLCWLAIEKLSVFGRVRQPLDFSISQNAAGVIMQCWSFSCIAFIGFWLIFDLGTFNQGSMIGVLWLWLGYEMLCSIKRYKPHKEALETVIYKFLYLFILIFLLTTIIWIFVSLFLVINSPLSGGNGGIDWLAAFNFITIGFAASYAPTVKLWRSIPQSANVVCQSCDNSMQRMDNHLLLKRLDDDDIINHLKPKEMMALANKTAEAWHCPICSPVYAENGLDFHLFSEVIRKKS